MWKMFAINMGITALQSLLLDPKMHEAVKPVCQKIFIAIKAVFGNDPDFQ